MKPDLLFVLLALLWTAFVVPGSAVADDLSGHLRLLALDQRTGDASVPSQSYGFSQCRCVWHHDLDSSGGLEAAGSVTLIRHNRFLADTEVSSSRIVDLTDRQEVDDQHTLLFDFDRLNLRFQMSQQEFCIGRQTAGFGRITLTSPLDLIAPFAPDALVSDIRPGIDALRWQYFLPGNQSLQAMGVFGEKPADHSYLLSYEALGSSVDVLLVGGSLSGRPVCGYGVAGQWHGLGIKGEVCHYHRSPREQGRQDLHRHFTQAGVEVDGQLAQGLVLAVEYFYNGVGSRRPQDAPELWQSAFYQQQRGYLTGCHYLLGRLGYECHPLVQLGTLWIWNLDDRSLLLQPTLHASLADDLSLDFFVAIGWGHRSSSAYPASEFGGRGPASALLVSCFF
ncbi:MAG: hypothetical protein JXR59_11125 [Desulfuromonadaceae bacterium]|nr:hypothetical protein [Desulfuromonadaceae bacterium]